MVNAIDNKYCSKCSYPLTPQAFEETKNDEEIRIKTLEKKYEKDIDNYNQALMNYNTFLKYLINKYKIKQSGNMIKRVAFILKNENTNMLKYEYS